MLFIINSGVWVENVVIEVQFVGVMKVGCEMIVNGEFSCGIWIFYKFLLFGVMVVIEMVNQVCC